MDEPGERVSVEMRSKTSRDSKRSSCRGEVNINRSRDDSFGSQDLNNPRASPERTKRRRSGEFSSDERPRSSVRRKKEKKSDRKREKEAKRIRKSEKRHDRSKEKRTRKERKNKSRDKRSSRLDVEKKPTCKHEKGQEGSGADEVHKILAKLLEAFPDAGPSVFQVFLVIDSGDEVITEGIKDDEMRGYLEALLRALHIECYTNPTRFKRSLRSSSLLCEQFSMLSPANSRPQAVPSISNSNAMDSSSSEDESDVEGPRPAGSTQARLPTEGALHQAAQAKEKLSGQSESLGSRHGREEWMLTPGESADKYGIIAASQQQRSRGFRSGKHQLTPAEQAAALGPARPTSEHEKQLAEKLSAFNQTQRGKSLMELHQAGLGQRKLIDDDNEVTGKAFSWDRERDMSLPNLDPLKTASIIKDPGAQLASRFTSAKSSRKFL
mmetsp:Transcript_20614/g.38371  ORF Transcript_20614/g.38371 Transcript_20614/m.38371 type:complete len:438 (+) Transcript_20614:355-1668(+)